MVLKKKGLNVSFYLLTPQAKQTLVYASISEKNTSAKERLRFSTGESFLTLYCNKRFEKKQAKGKATVIKNGKELLKRNTTFYLEYQSKLNKITEWLHEIYQEKIRLNKPIFLNEIRDEYYIKAGLVKVVKKTVETAFNEYIQYNLPHWGNSTQTKVNTTLKHILDYEKKYGEINLELADINLFNSIRDKYLVADLKMGNSTVNKYMQYVEAFFKFSKKKGYIKSDFDFDETRNLKEIEPFKIALRLNEVEKLSNLDLSDNPRLQKVRDIFLLDIFTGQRWSDAGKVLSEFNNSPTGISFTQDKTNVRITVPLHPKLKMHRDRLFNRYPDGLVSNTNQKFNDYIKEVGELAGFTEKHEWVTLSGTKKTTHSDFRYNLLSSHTGRRTFATLALKQRIPEFEIMKITGHKKLETFRQYVKVDDAHLHDSFADFLT